MDYDPAGYWIERSFREQLEAFGMEVAGVHPLVGADRLDPDRVAYSKYRLKDSSKTRNWVEATGGIGGEPYGLEADVLRKKELLAAFEEAMEETPEPFSLTNM